jgi:hypothetical protein
MAMSTAQRFRGSNIGLLDRGQFAFVSSFVIRISHSSACASQDHGPTTHEPHHRSADAHIRAALSQVRELADVGIRAPIFGRFMVPMHGPTIVEATHEPLLLGRFMVPMRAKSERRLSVNRSAGFIPQGRPLVPGAWESSAVRNIERSCGLKSALLRGS